MYEPIEGYRELGIAGGSLIEYWDGEGGLADAQLIVGGKELALPGLLCRKVDAPEPMARIATALERIADALEAIQRNGVPVENVSSNWKAARG